MIKIVASVIVMITLSGCSKVPEYIDTKVLHDENGCAFVANKHIGDTMFLMFSKKDSKESCKYAEYVGE